MVRTGLCPRSCAGCRSVAACRRKSKHPSGRKRTMLKTTAAAVVAIALAWATPALAQNPPPQERIHERLDVSFRGRGRRIPGPSVSQRCDHQPLCSGRLPARAGRLRVLLRTHATRRVERGADRSYCQERGRGHRPRHSPAVVSGSRVPRRRPAWLPVPALPFRRSAQGGDTAHAEVDQQRAAGQRLAE